MAFSTESERGIYQVKLFLKDFNQFSLAFPLYSILQRIQYLQILRLSGALWQALTCFLFTLCVPIELRFRLDLLLLFCPLCMFQAFIGICCPISSHCL